MKHLTSQWRQTALAAVIAVALPLNAAADSTVGDDTYEALKSQVEMLQQQLQQIQETLKQYEQQTVTNEEVQELKQELAEVASQQSEWKNTDSIVHLAGYGDATYSDKEGSPGAFSGARFNPIFHYQYKDLLMLGAEMAIEVEDDGGTSTELEYTTIHLFATDYLAVGGGKFLSPTGQFRQNIHPSWINKLPTAPSGFGHDQAAPISEVGLQGMGGFLVAGLNINYGAYVGNGPILEIDAVDGEIEAVEAEGRTSNDDDKLVYGGRLGLAPWPNSEVGVSFATGEVAGEDEKNNATRDYDVYGADAAYKWRNLGLRGEFIKQKVGSAGSSAAPNSASWQAWYAQAAYRFMPTNFEGVVRYSDYDANLKNQDQEQWALGINYLFAPNAMAKLAYNFNDGKNNSNADDNAFQVQFAYGF